MAGLPIALALLALLLTSSACTAQNAALMFLPRATPRTPADPLQPLIPPRPPPQLARQAEAGQVGLASTKLAKIDFAVSAVGAMLWLLGGSAPLFGLAGTFDENDLLAPGRRRSVSDSQARQARQRRQRATVGAQEDERAAPAADEDLRTRSRGYTPGAPAPRP